MQRNSEGDEFAFFGVVHQARANELVIQTFEWEGLPDHVTLETLRFEALPGGRSRVTGLSLFPRVEDRDGMIENGMEQGVIEGYARLDTLLA
ncbi:hypothetical protein ACEXQD_01320 [Herbiconiux sp. P15]|uniref:hypothetical protein n=1 Tax=Herbiconiux liukaitaii TaxID=3342799 RepID=UPI0035B80692